MEIARADWHNHTHRSNIINRDSTNFETDLIDRAIKLGLKGIGITDHGNLSAHITCIKHLKKLQKEAKEKLDLNKNELTVENLEYYDRVNEFKLGLGTEIYLVHREDILSAREKNEYTRFYHLVVLAKNRQGYQALRELSTNSWEESFYFRGMLRTPTYWDWFKQWALRNKGNIIITTACLGSEFSHLVMKFIEEQTIDNRNKIINFVKTMVELFGEDFYIEIQPSYAEEQIVYNQLAVQIAEQMNIKVVIDCDSHYLSKEMKEIHSIFLRSQDAERETEAFYASTYLMSVEELKEYFSYLDSETFNKFMNNSLEIADKIENYDLYKETEVRKTTIQFDDNWEGIFSKESFKKEFDINKYPYICKYISSEHVIDLILLQQIEKGIVNKNIKINEEVLDRLNREFEALWEISEKLHQRMASYYLLTKEIVEIMWLVSLVGVSRGSAGAFYICYLLDITQINPIESAFNLPEWRHIDKNKVELADIDIDTEKGQRFNILEKVKEKYGRRKVINIATFKTEGTVSAIQTICRGMGITTEESSYISSLAVDGMTVKECLDNFETNRECGILIREMMAYEGLIESVIAVEGLICGRSIHASGVYIYNDDYDVNNAMMKSPNGQEITQYDMLDSDYQGGLKLDFLTVEALDRIRKDMELLLEDGLIEWQGDLKSTYNKYLHPDVLDLEDKEMWKMLREGKILDAFQYDSPQGRNAIAIIEPENFQQVAEGNALMRLSCDGEQPIHRYSRFKKDINSWYEEMIDYGLREDEVEVMRKHLDKSFGVASTQESVMRLSMDSKIANFDLVWANKLRKAIAKSYAKDMIEPVRQHFIQSGTENGNRELFLNYVWESCIVPQLGYSFSEPHIMGYSLILLQEMNLAKLSLLHWSVACLCVNAGDINDEISKSTDYGAIAKAIARMKKGFVIPPNINESKLGFRVDMTKNKALYGLSAINGISSDLAKEIISLRPFNSFDDFIERAIKTKIVQPSKMYNLIKAGCFDCFNNNRLEVMLWFINYLVPEKTKLTTANLPKIFEYGMIPDHFRENYCLFLFKREVFKECNCYYKINKTHGIYRVGKNEEIYTMDFSSFESAIEYDDNGGLCLNSKEFDKIYKVYQNEFLEWLNSESTLKNFNYCIKNEVWVKYCCGSIAKWEMESLCYYTKIHELEELNINKYYTLSNFFDLPKDPVTYEEQNVYSGRVYRKNRLYMIAGVVIEKNKAKSMITVSTIEGVVEVKMNKEMFTHFDRKTPNEASWFNRGTKLLLAGFRRGEVFTPKVYKNSIFESPITKIEINASGTRIRTKREFEEEEMFYY